MRFRGKVDVSDIGRVVDTPAKFDGQGNKTQDATFRNGHFVVSVVAIPAWEAWRVTSITPLPRVFAGRLDSSTLYQFPSEAAFINAFESQGET